MNHCSRRVNTFSVLARGPQDLVLSPNFVKLLNVRIFTRLMFTYKIVEFRWWNLSINYVLFNIFLN
jgi:hypothetical protein